MNKTDLKSLGKLLPESWVLKEVRYLSHAKGHFMAEDFAGFQDGWYATATKPIPGRPGYIDGGVDACAGSPKEAVEECVRLIDEHNRREAMLKEEDELRTALRAKYGFARNYFR